MGAARWLVRVGAQIASRIHCLLVTVGGIGGIVRHNWFSDSSTDSQIHFTKYEFELITGFSDSPIDSLKWKVERILGFSKSFKFRLFWTDSRILRLILCFFYWFSDSSFDSLFLLLILGFFNWFFDSSTDSRILRGMFFQNQQTVLNCDLNLCNLTCCFVLFSDRNWFAVVSITFCGFIHSFRR